MCVCVLIFIVYKIILNIREVVGNFIYVLNLSLLVIFLNLGMFDCSLCLWVSELIDVNDL